MRRYEHDPDGAWIQDRVRFTQAMLEAAARRVEITRSDGGPPHALALEVALGFALQRVQYGWADGESPATLSELLDQAALWVREAATVTTRPLAPQVERWLCIALLAGDRELAENVAGRVPSDIDDLEMQFPVTRDFLLGLARLVQTDRNGAAQAGAAVEQASAGDDPTPAATMYYGGLGELLIASATRDQPAFDHAVAIRTAALARLYGHSPQARRHPHGLLDPQGAAVAAVASSIGLRPPARNVPLASELLEAR